MKTRTVPAILPREPLTAKARGAIHKYAAVKGDKVMNLQYYMINIVLEAERMRRADLYKWLEARGYKWSPRSGWIKRKEKA